MRDFLRNIILATEVIFKTLQKRPYVPTGPPAIAFSIHTYTDSMIYA